ncbi:hypothetical protein C9374_013637 [Naegleria lovaniensis]|uniref:G8 domain-containing protein n=1 Tax=Naegleria lovaniensis TaxID=51637 RepID=A0AA88KHB5_NAELO|nr:uncharacterized protein C9374_013637 [Naegleria lovaniensis]KAG2372682.1 hypothetical protein C9374_013637 [Naegleria lovaniensis]
MKVEVIPNLYMSSLLLSIGMCVFMHVLWMASMTHAQSSCPHLDSGLIKFSTLPNYNVLNADLTITQRTLVDKSPGVKLRSIQVLSGASLVFNDVADIALDVEWIRVASGASFIMGSPSCPIQHKIVVTFYGNRTADDVIGVDPYDNTPGGSKGIVFQSGSMVQIHGQVPTPTWTFLAKTVKDGENVIKLTEKTSWKVGDSLVIANTDYGELVETRKVPYSEGLGWMNGVPFPAQTEERTVVSVLDGGSTLVLNKPLNYTHWGNAHMKAEVGVLNRNIVFQGDANSVKDSFGGHMMIRVVEKATLEGIEMTRMGQRGFMGRYAIHWHILGDKAPENDSYYIKSSVVHHGFQRCVVIHDSNNILIQGNVCYKNVGHQFFLEDGGEMGNKFIKNLGIDPIAVGNNDPTQILPSDADVSVFWITNPNNTWIGNSAVGSKFNYWFSMPLKPTGLSSSKYANNPLMTPRTIPLKVFEDNIAHSGNQNGIHIDDMVMPNGKTEAALYRPADPFGKPVVAYFKRVISYKNRRYGIWSEGGPVLFSNIIASDNRIQMGCPPGPVGIFDSTLIGDSENVGDLKSMRPGLDTDGRTRSIPYAMADQITKGFETYDNGGPQVLDSITFINFTSTPSMPAGALGALSNAPFKHESRNRYQNLKFINANEFFLLNGDYDGNKGSVILVTDNSIKSVDPVKFKSGGWLISNDSVVAFKECIFKQEWQGGMCPLFAEGYSQIVTVNPNITGSDTTGSNGVPYPDVADPLKRVPRIRYIDMVRNRETVGNGASISRSNGVIEFIMDVNLINRGFYTVRWVHNTPTPRALKFIHQGTALNDWLVMSVQYAKGTTFTITKSRFGNPTTMQKGNSMEEIMNDPMKYFFDEKSEHLFIKMQNRPDYGKYYRENWNFTDPISDFSQVTIDASCPNDKCSPSSFELPPNANLFHKMYNKEERYAGILQSCQQSLVSPVKFVPKQGSGVVFAFTSPDRLQMDFVVHHDLVGTATEIEVGFGNEGQEKRFLKVPYYISPHSVARFIVDLSYNDYVSLLRGEMFVKVSSLANPNGHLRAQVLCNNGKTNGCSLPSPIAKVDMCAAVSSPTIDVYTDFEKTKSLWTYSVFSHALDSRTAYLNSSHVHADGCGTSSLRVGFQNGAVAMNRVDKNAARVDLTQYKYLEFYVKSLTGAVKLVLYPSETVNNAVVDLPSYPIQPRHIDNYVIDDTRFSRVRIPLAELATTSKLEANITRLLFKLASTHTSNFYEMIFENIRFIKEAGSPEPTHIPITSNEIAYLTDSTFCGNKVSQDPDYDPFGMRTAVLPPELSSSSPLPPVEPSRSMAHNRTVSSGNAKLSHGCRQRTCPTLALI